MKTSNPTLWALASSLALLFSVSVMAAETVKEEGANTDPEAKPPVSETVAAVQDRALAGQLIAYGDKAKDPLALILAAKILKSTPTQPAERPKEGAAAPKEAQKEGGNKHEVSAILARAKTLAAGRQDLLAMIADVEAMTAKGRTGGPGYTVTQVAARSTDTYTIRFRGNELAAVGIEGDGDTDLDLYVYDQNGHLICSDLSYIDAIFCSWTPRWTGNFTIKVVNRGNVYNQYGLLTN